MNSINTQKELHCNDNGICLTINDKMLDENKRRIAGQYLQNERLKTGVSAIDAAKFGEIQPVQLSRIENGHSGARRETLINLVTGINDRSTGYQINLTEVLFKFGYAPSGDTEDELSAEIRNDLRISLQGGGKGISKKQKQEIIDLAVKIARGVIADGDNEASEGENH